jgi:dsDNA-binding SOS-regulon protein
MAVESRFVVIRHGVEVQTFMDKKAADDYDKMLDMADNLTSMLDDTPFEMTDELKEDLSIYLAQNRDDVLVALQAKKAKPATAAKSKPVAKKPASENPTSNPVEETLTTQAPAELSTVEEVTENPVATKVPVKKRKKKEEPAKSDTED